MEVGCGGEEGAGGGEGTAEFEKGKTERETVLAWKIRNEGVVEEEEEEEEEEEKEKQTHKKHVLKAMGGSLVEA